jgi:hypothetical protein
LKIEYAITKFPLINMRCTIVFKLSTSSLSALAAVALAVASAAPSFAWGWGWPGSASEVSNRDAVLANEIANDQGHLGGRYGRLSQEDKAIRRQEQSDLWQNGGYLTNGQKRQLNAEENNLQRQVNYDNYRR